jgi:Tol biopolymer transport system component/DNA-binding winged helix-turn-helix (wHTH) protein
VSAGSQKGWRIGAWTFEPSRQRLSRDDRTELLPRKISDVLGHLARNAGQVVTREALIRDVWSDNQFTGPHGLANAIWQLRRVLDEDEAAEGIIETIAKSGYRLKLEAHPLGSVAPSAPQPPLDSPSAQEPEKPHTAAPSRRRFWISAVVAAAGGLVTLLTYGGFIAGTRSEMTALRPEPLTMLDGLEEYPAFSRDGRWLAFTWEREERPSQILARDMTHPDAPLRQLSVGSDSEVRPVWSPDAARIALAKVTSSGECTVLIRDISTYQEHAVAPCFYERLHQIFDWSPDGSTLAIARQVGVADSVAIYLHSAQGGPGRQLTLPQQGAQDSQIAWSHDGKTLAFVRRVAEAGELYITDLAGHERRLTSDGAGIYGLTWLPGDTELAFSSMRDGNFAIWRIATAGGAPRLYSRIEWPFNMTAIPNTIGAIAVSQHKSLEHLEIRRLSDGELLNDLRSGGRDLFAQWSADNNRLLFISTRGGRYEPWTSDTDGNNARKLNIPQGSPGLPAWSPSDYRYAIAWRPAGRSHDQIYIGDAAGDNLRQVATDEHDYQNVAWEPGGRSLIASSNRSGTWELWRYQIENGTFEQLTHEGGEYGQLVGTALFHSRHGMPGLWKLRVGEHKPELVMDALAVDDWGNWRIANEALYYIARTAEHDQLRQRDLTNGKESVLLSMPSNSIRPYKSMSLSTDGRVVLTILGRRQAEIVALRPGS